MLVTCFPSSLARRLSFLARFVWLWRPEPSTSFTFPPAPFINLKNTEREQRRRKKRKKKKRNKFARTNYKAYIYKATHSNTQQDSNRKKEKEVQIFGHPQTQFCYTLCDILLCFRALFARDCYPVASCIHVYFPKCFFGCSFFPRHFV